MVPSISARLPEQVEGQKAEAARRAAERAALSKLERIRLDQSQRARTLEEEASHAELTVGARTVSQRADVLV